MDKPTNLHVQIAINQYFNHKRCVYFTQNYAEAEVWVFGRNKQK